MFRYLVRVLCIAFLLSPFYGALAYIVCFDGSLGGEASMARSVERFLKEKDSEASIQLIGRNSDKKEDLGALEACGASECILFIGQYGFDVMVKHQDLLKGKGVKPVHVSHQVADLHQQIKKGVSVFLPTIWPRLRMSGLRFVMEPYVGWRVCLRICPIVRV